MTRTGLKKGEGRWGSYIPPWNLPLDLPLELLQIVGNTGRLGPKTVLFLPSYIAKGTRSYFFLFYLVVRIY